MKQLSLLMLLAATFSYSQNTVNGSIFDQKTNPVSFASIYFPQLEKGGATDENGNFSVENIPNGEFKTIVSIIGYESKSMIVKVPQDFPLEIILKASAIEMEEVIISTPFHKLQSENIMKVERLNAQDLKSQGSVTLSDGITNISGVESISTGISVGKPVIRGLSANRVLVYTQGIRLENQQFGDEHGLGVNSYGIESVEVIKGPSTLLYGSDALGGVVYLNPEGFANKHETHGALESTYFSNTNGLGSSISIKTSGDHLKWLVRGSLVNHSDYETKNYSVTNSRFNEKDLKGGVGYQRNQFKTEVRYNYYATEIGLTEGVGVQTNDKKPEFPYQDIVNHILSSKSNVFFDNSSIDLNLGYTFNNRKEFEETESPALHMKLKTFNYDLKYNFPRLGKFETIFGVQGMYQTNSNFGEEQLIPDATTVDIGFLGTSHIHFEKMDFQLGARYDRRNIDVSESINKTYNSFNGAAGVKTNILEDFSLRFNVASGFRAPNLAELTSDGVHEGTNRYEIGNPDLENEQNIQLDLALEYKGEHFEFFANGFYNFINNYIYLNPLGNLIEENPVFEYQQTNANLYGGEFGLHIHPHPLDWLHIESGFETVTAKRADGDYLPLTPANSINNTVRVEFETDTFKKGYGFVKLQNVFEQNNVSAFETASNGYSLLNAGLGANFNFLKGELSGNITATNILNKEYISHLSRLKNDGIYNIGRNISVGLSYLF
ncbi:iron complex outermembrane recepter protein [Flavobacteriaceae bacterium MAR_2010_188]|nr:iron complex outermembrane recepter protein [Flavobacteriaceae bacterium MAR_2010_188]